MLLRCLRLPGVRPVAVLLMALSVWPFVAQANDSSDLAKQLANPIANLISVPIQLNFDERIGQGDEGRRWIANIQPVVPISLNSEWNVISRTIVPIIQTDDIPFAGADTASGVGDLFQSFFFSPKQPTASGWIWGVGPAFLIPSGDDRFSGDTWAAGPTAVALRQAGPWTYGGLFNHVWSLGDDPVTDVNSTFVQPFVSYTTPSAWTYTLNAEATYDWETDELSLPINAVVAKLTQIGNQPVSLAAGLRYWAESPEGGPEGLGGRLVVTFLFPK